MEQQIRADLTRPAYRCQTHHGPLGERGDPELDHWYEANLSIETHVLKLLTN
jgi:hypothetical protein